MRYHATIERGWVSVSLNRKMMNGVISRGNTEKEGAPPDDATSRDASSVLRDQHSLSFLFVSSIDSREDTQQQLKLEPSSLADLRDERNVEAIYRAMRSSFPLRSATVTVQCVFKSNQKVLTECS